MFYYIQYYTIYIYIKVDDLTLHFIKGPLRSPSKGLLKPLRLTQQAVLYDDGASYPAVVELVPGTSSQQRTYRVTVMEVHMVIRRSTQEL